MPDPNIGNLTVGDVVYVGLEGRMYGQRILNTFYYRCKEVTDAATRWGAYQDLVNAFTVAGGLEELFLNCLSQDYALEFMRLQYVSPLRRIYRRFPRNVNGALLGDTETANLCMSIERRTDAVGRHGVGRLQLPGLPNNTTAAGMILPGHLATVNLLAIFMQFDVLAGATFGQTWEPVLFSASQVGPDVVGPIVDAFPHPQVRTMSRRTVGRGE